MRAWEDLTNVQFPMLNSHPKGEAAACVRSCPASVEHLAIRHPLRMRIEHWELSIGQIPGRIQGSGFCQVIFARALSGRRWGGWFKHRLSEVERTTPAAPPKERDHLLDGAATPPLPRRGFRLSRRLSRRPVPSGRLVVNAQTS